MGILSLQSSPHFFMQIFLCYGEQSWDNSLAAPLLSSTCTASPARLLRSLLSVLQILSQLGSRGTPAPMGLHPALLPGSITQHPPEPQFMQQSSHKARWLRAWRYHFTAAVSVTQINQTRYRRCGWPFTEDNYIKLAEHPSILNSCRGLTPHSSPAREAFAICKILPLTPLPSWLKYNFICLNAREEADPTCFSGPEKPQGAVGGMQCMEQAARPWESQRPPAFTCKATGESEHSTAKSTEKSTEKSPTLRAESCIEK